MIMWASIYKLLLRFVCEQVIRYAECYAIIVYNSNIKKYIPYKVGISVLPKRVGICIFIGNLLCNSQRSLCDSKHIGSI